MHYIISLDTSIQCNARSGMSLVESPFSKEIGDYRNIVDLERNEGRHVDRHFDSEKVEDMQRRQRLRKRIAMNPNWVLN